MSRKIRRLFRYTISFFGVAATTLGCSANAASNAAAPPSPTVSPALNTPAATSSSLEFFLLPDGYRGPVIAIYDQIDGAKPVLNSDTALYEVPGNGILRIALSQPPQRRVMAAFKGSATEKLRTFPTCAEMRRAFPAGEPVGTCWLSEIGASNAPSHEAFIVTQWQGIPVNYNRGMSMLDSLVFGGHFHGGIKWVEPPNLTPKPGRKASVVAFSYEGYVK
jgi:hypothetical protein